MEQENNIGKSISFGKVITRTINYLCNINSIKKGTSGIFRWLYLVGNGFIKDNCLLRASALTYTTVLSIVPFFAVVFSISKGIFGLQNTQPIRDILTSLSAGRQDIVNYIIQYINNTNVGSLGVTGMSFLLLTVIMLLSNIEKSFNSIWGIMQHRNIKRKFTDYLSAIIVFPTLSILAAFITIFLKNLDFMSSILNIEIFNNMYRSFINFLPYIMVWMALTFIYIFIPNTKVRFFPAFFAAIIAGSLWQILQFIYISSLKIFINMDKIYGSFSQVPLFMIWLYITWVIVLFGAEISFAIQNFKTFKKEATSLNISSAEKEKFALRIMLMIARNYYDEKLLTNEEISEKLNIPVKLINDITDTLSKNHVLIETERNGTLYFLPGKPLDKLTLYSVLEEFRNTGEIKLEYTHDKEFDYINKLINSLKQFKEKNLKNISLLKIITNDFKN